MFNSREIINTRTRGELSCVFFGGARNGGTVNTEVVMSVNSIEAESFEQLTREL